MAKIHEALRAAKEEIGAIPKSHTNSGVGGGYKFRSVEDALNMAGPILRKHGITCVPRVVQHRTSVNEGTDRSGKARTECMAAVLMEMDLIADDGSQVTVSMAGEGMDYGGDKATSKSLSQAFKYCIFLGLQVPVEEGDLDDSDRDQPARRERKQAKPVNGDSRFTLALQSVLSAKDATVLERYSAAIAKRIEQGEWTAAEVGRLEQAIGQRKRELRIPDTEGADEPDPQWIKAAVITGGCPEELVDNIATLAATKADPAKWVKSKPWLKETASA